MLTCSLDSSLTVFHCYFISPSICNLAFLLLRVS